MVITIDGLCINGKTTLAKMIATKYNYEYFNTGAIYRCIALLIIEKKLDIDNIGDIINEIKKNKIIFNKDKVLINDIDVSSKIKEEKISIKSTEWATIPEIKEVVRNIQKEFIKNHNTVIEGRDIATRIATNADIKFYLYSDFETRVDRMYQTNNIDKETIRKNIKLRDDIDINEGNFIKPTNAYEIDTTKLSLNEVYEKMVGIIEEMR